MSLTKSKNLSVIEAPNDLKRHKCSADASHERLDLHINRCLECNKRLQEFCGECSSYTSFAHMSRHTKRHRATRFPAPEPAVVARRLKVAYVATQWDLDTKDGKLLMGQFLRAVPDNISFKPRHHHVNDKTGSYDVVDAYDALWSQVFAKDSFEDVRVYKTLDSAVDALESRKLPDGLDLLIMGDWTHPRKDVEMEEITKVYNLLMYCGVRVFPLLDYA